MLHDRHGRRGQADPCRRSSGPSHAARRKQLTRRPEERHDAGRDSKRPRRRHRIERQGTRRAAELGIFGAPSFVVAGELFWGDDRLEDAVADYEKAVVAPEARRVLSHFEERVRHFDVVSRQ